MSLEKWQVWQVSHEQDHDPKILEIKRIKKGPKGPFFHLVLDFYVIMPYTIHQLAKTPFQKLFSKKQHISNRKAAT